MRVWEERDPQVPVLLSIAGSPVGFWEKEASSSTPTTKLHTFVYRGPLLEEHLLFPSYVQRPLDTQTIEHTLGQEMSPLGASVSRNMKVTVTFSDFMLQKRCKRENTSEPQTARQT